MIDNDTRKQEPGNHRFLVKLIQVILFIPIQIAFIPFAFVGLAIALYREFKKTRELGISFSAVKALQYRWLMHYFNTRPDPFSVAFTKAFPCESHFGMWSIMGPLFISTRLFGFPEILVKLVEPGKETAVSTAGIRVLTFDRIMETYVDEVDQIVLPGVGFDLISQHFTEGKNVKVFELDQINTLNIKTETLKRAGIKHDWITYVPIDYEVESWVDKLLEAGFDRTRKTLFLWQSVSLYLDADIVKQTLKDMADLCTDGSVIAQDFYSKTFISGEFSKSAKRFMKIIEKRGEPARFGIDMSKDPRAAAKSFLVECGLKVTKHIQFGDKLKVEPLVYCIVEAKRL